MALAMAIRSVRLVTLIIAAAAVLSAGPRVPPQASEGAFDVAIRVNAATPTGPLTPIWRFFGADEPNYAYMHDGEALIAELGRLAPGHMFFRAHNLLTSGDGTPGLKWGSTNAYQEDSSGRPVHDWTIVDRIFDTYLRHDVRPYVEIGFMPEALSTHPEPYRHSWSPTASYDQIFTGWSYPPTDLKKWGDLVHAWAAHAVERYGREEVERWYWEVWNEPNIGYWRGTPAEFLALDDHAIDGVRRALPTARVGGPDTAGHGGAFTRSFLEHALRGVNSATGATGRPLDFVSFHAKGKPTVADGHVRMGIANELATIDGGFELIASFPELRRTPIVIGEADPDGCAACQGPQLAYRNTTLYSSYTAASFARMLDLADRHGVNLEGALTWAFEFEGQPCFAGFRVLATCGIDLPVLNVFRLFNQMAASRLAVQSDGAGPLDDLLKDGVRGRPDVGALASRDARRVTILAWHYHDDDVPGPDARVALAVEGLPLDSGRVHAQRYAIDDTHANAYTAWRGMGSPGDPSPAERALLEQAGRLVPVEGLDSLAVSGSRANVSFTLPRRGVSLVVVDW
jgi:xylan 1,4-beta-xylosidase